MTRRRIYIISDLHLGGESGSDGNPGFRMMTHEADLAAFVRAVGALGGELVINGDFFDFLAEEHDQRWSPFLASPELALATFDRMAARPEVSAVLDALLGLGEGRLTLLLGNHDLELSLPPVTARLRERLGGPRVLFDGEPLVLGDAIVEHGNRLDPFNRVAHDDLRRLRFAVRDGHPRTHFVAPAGSHIVAEVMNPIKREYQFIDLLKPESEPLIAVLLAIDPESRRDLLPFVRLAFAAHLPASLQKIALGPADEAVSYYGAETSDAVHDALEAALGKRDAAAFELALAATARVSRFEEEVSFSSATGLLQLLISGHRKELRERLPAVRLALQGLAGDRSFDPGFETGRRYLGGAAQLAGRGYRTVVFGHTHFGRDLLLPCGAHYINTGTWANLMRFPPALLAPDDDTALAVLERFLADLAANRLDTEFRPQYAMIELDDDGHVEGRLADWNGSLCG